MPKESRTRPSRRTVSRGAWAGRHGARCMARSNGTGRGVPGGPWNTPCSAGDPTRQSRNAWRTGLDTRPAPRSGWNVSCTWAHFRRGSWDTAAGMPCPNPGSVLVRSAISGLSGRYEPAGSTSDASPRSRPVRPPRIRPPTRGFADLASIGGWLRRRIDRGRRSGAHIRRSRLGSTVMRRPATVDVDADRITYQPEPDGPEARPRAILGPVHAVLRVASSRQSPRGAHPA